MAAIGQTVDARFERTDPNAMARTLSFKIRPEDLARLTELYEKQVMPLIVELDRQAVAEGGAGIPMNVAMMWAPDGDGAEQPTTRRTKEST